MSYIDYELIRINYNKQNKTNFKTEKEMFETLYLKYKSSFKIGRLLFVSHTAIQRQMRSLDVKLIRGKGFKSKIKEDILKLGLKVKTMTAQEIAKNIGCHKVYASRVLNDNSINFLRLKPWGNND